LLDDLRVGLDIPTQTCVLTHVTNTLELIHAGAPVDLCFQSIAGTQAANRGFGISLDLLDEAHAATQSLARGTVGQNVMYFETGQGSCLSSIRIMVWINKRWSAGPIRSPDAIVPAGQFCRRVHRAGISL
jgi:ethanolamine ammonia-lyase large subunit